MWKTITYKTSSKSSKGNKAFTKAFEGFDSTFESLKDVFKGINDTAEEINNAVDEELEDDNVEVTSGDGSVIIKGDVKNVILNGKLIWSSDK